MLPNLVVIGAQKCGTSALHYYLSLHPEVSMSDPKELNFFIRPQEWKRGIEWYESHFTEDAKVRGESSPNYTNHPRSKGVPRRMHSVVPDAKLILLVRDPLQRIVSAYIHNAARGREKRDLSSAISHARSTYVVRSRYHMQVERFLKFYPASSLLVIEQGELLEHRPEALARVFRFLEVDDSFWSPKYERLRHETKNKLRLHRDVRKRLEQDVAEVRVFSSEKLGVTRNLWRLKEDADALRELTGKPFEGWSL